MMDDVKQVIVIRRDLKMRRGKEIAQGAHASMAWLGEQIRKGKSFAHGYDREPEVQSLVDFTMAEWLWLDGAFTKITCQVQTEQELLEIHQAALDAGLTSILITDAGRTEFGGVPTVTALAVGPDYASRIDPVTGHLALY